MKTFAEVLYVVWIYKNRTQNKSADFIYFWMSSSCEIWAKTVLEEPWFEKIRPALNEIQSFSVGHFLGKFGEIWAKIFRTSKNLPAPTPMNVCL